MEKNTIFTFLSALVLGLAIGLMIGYSWGYQKGEAVNSLKIGPDFHLQWKTQQQK